MTFLAIDSQKNLFTLQKSQLQFEQTLVMNQANWLAKEMSARAEQLEAASGNGQVDLDNDAYYVSLQKQEEYLTTRQNTLATAKRSRCPFFRTPKLLPYSSETTAPASRTASCRT